MSLRFKRHYPILLILVAVVLVLTLVFGNQRVIAYAVDGSGEVEEETITYTNDVALFDDTVVHTIQVIMSEADYDQMVTTYQQTGEKDYFHADIIIDGVRINDVGIRLKGNASLMTALGGTGSMGNMQGGMGAMEIPEGFDPANLPEGFNVEDMPMLQGFDPNNPPEGFDPNNMPQRAAPGGQVAGAAPGDQAADAAPQAMAPAGGAGQAQGMTFGGQSGEVKIPFLIKFDEFVPGQTYQGYTKLALRTYGITYDEAMLEEPLTNYAFEVMGLPATQTAYAGLQINDEAEVLYVLSEVVDDPVYLARNFSNPDGVLYKAEVGSSLTYVNEDPSSYTRSFSQGTRVNDADLAPLIAFSRFLTQSDDATFESELPDTLDVDSFATYLALTSLLVNNDSIAGMNNNYYLYYDDLAGGFTLLYWDGNESLGGLGMGASTNADIYFENVQSMRGGMGGSQNILLERFLAIPSFRQLYEEKLQLVYEQIFLSGALTEKAEQVSTLIHTVNAERDLVDITNYEAAVENIQTFLRLRQEYLQTTALLGQ
jgi:spore coat protein CotH